MNHFQLGLSEHRRKFFEENMSKLSVQVGENLSKDKFVLHEDTRNALKDNIEKYKILNEYMIKHNYPPIDNLSIFDFFHEIEKPVNDSIDNMDKIISKYFDETHVDWLFKNIEEYNLETEAKNILAETIKGYKQGYYNLVIPTLFSRLEGMLYNSVSYNKQGSYIELKRIMTAGIDKYNGKFFDVLSEEDKQTLKDNYTKKMLEHFEFGNDDTEFSRHSIMHGSSLKYGTKINCIKLFLHFEYLYNCVQELDKDYFSWK
ncbi:hypothetical protein MXL22_00735 [Staphylococcus pseudoxylosus]|uniref:hypothetical protein n=1 Tax=Staphylococcus pseudoxylosus TaxID=2282419 RepID=UPI002DB78A32|nr:hypothetical protein [Staphylococcus pseudoxylosus]MEB6059608.1 hypothetical protein [Staphylococcus pseudoxylosus]